MFKINKIFFLFSVALVFFTIFHTSILVVHAQPAPDSYIPLAPLPNTVEPEGGTHFGTYVKGLFGLLIGVAGVLAVIKIVIGGIQYMSTDAISGKSEGKDMITQALYGLFLAMACWLILYTINPNLLNFDVLNTSVPYTSQDRLILKLEKCTIPATSASSSATFVQQTWATFPYDPHGGAAAFNAAMQLCERTPPPSGPSNGMSDIPGCINDHIFCDYEHE